jgi:hypothetical protein
MMGANDAMADAVFLSTETNARETGSVRCTMDSACRMMVSVRCVMSIMRGMTDSVSRTTDGVGLTKDPMRPMLGPNRDLTVSMRATTRPVRTTTSPPRSMRRALRPTMDTMRLRTTAIAGMTRAIGAVLPPIGSRMGAKRTMTTGLGPNMGTSARMKSTIPGSHGGCVSSERDGAGPESVTSGAARGRAALFTTEDTENRHGKPQLICCCFRVPPCTSVSSVVNHDETQTAANFLPDPGTQPVRARPHPNGTPDPGSRR